MTHIDFTILNSHITVKYSRFIKSTNFFMVKQKNLKQLYFILLLNWNDLSENLSFQILFKKIWAGIFFF